MLRPKARTRKVGRYDRYEEEEEEEEEVGEEKDDEDDEEEVGGEEGRYYDYDEDEAYDY